MSLEIPMCPKRFLNMARSSQFSVELDGFEVLDVLWETIRIRSREKEERERHTRVKEHVSHARGLLVDFEGMSGEDYALRDDAGRVWIEERSCRDQMRGWPIVRNIKHKRKSERKGYLVHPRSLEA